MSIFFFLFQKTVISVAKLPNIYSPIYTLLLPFRISPYTDGRSWARREGCESHGGVRDGEELTDEGDEGDESEE